MMAERQRRTLAAIQPGPTGPFAQSVVVPPEPSASTTPSTVELTGRASIRDNASLNLSVNRASLGVRVTFADNEDVAGWVREQSDEIAVVFAARAALRAVPTITFSPWSRSARRTTPEIMLRVFRAVAAAWAVATYPGQRDMLNRAARAALTGLGDLNAPSAIRAAVYAAATASGEANAALRASTVLDYTLDAVEF